VELPQPSVDPDEPAGGVSRPVATGRVQRRRQVTRDRLIAVAVNLFATRGYEQTSMDLVATEADVARTTVFNYFSRKDELLRAGLAGQRDVIAERLRATRGTMGTKARIDTALAGWAGGYELDPGKGVALVRAWIQAGGPHLADAAATAALFSEVIHDGQLAGDVRETVDSGAAGLMIFDCAVGALVRWGSPAPAAGPADLAAAMRQEVDLAVMGILVRHY
jgi:AcrR family transcriptional regulator